MMRRGLHNCLLWRSFATLSQDEFPNVPKEVLRFTTVKEFYAYALKHGAKLKVGGGGHIRVEKDGEHDTWPQTGSRELPSHVRKSTIKFFQRANIIKQLTDESIKDDDTISFGSFEELLNIVESNYDTIAKVLDDLEIMRKERDDALEIAVEAQDERLMDKLSYEYELEEMRLNFSIENIESERQSAKHVLEQAQNAAKKLDQSNIQLFEELNCLKAKNQQLTANLQSANQQLEELAVLKKKTKNLERQLIQKENELVQIQQKVQQLPDPKSIFIEQVLIPLKQTQAKLFSQQIELFLELKEVQIELMLKDENLGPSFLKILINRLRFWFWYRKCRFLFDGFLINQELADVWDNTHPSSAVLPLIIKLLKFKDVYHAASNMSVNDYIMFLGDFEEEITSMIARANVTSSSSEDEDEDEQVSMKMDTTTNHDPNQDQPPSPSIDMNHYDDHSRHAHRRYRKRRR